MVIGCNEKEIMYYIGVNDGDDGEGDQRDGKNAL